MSVTSRFRDLGNMGGRAVNGTNTAGSNNNGAAPAAKRRPLSSAAFSLRPHGNKPHGRRGKTLMGRNTVLSKLLWPGQKPQNATSTLDQGPKLKDQSGPRKQYSIEDLLKMREEHRELPKDLPHFAGITGLGLGLRDDAPDTWDMPTDITPKETEITRPKAEIPILTRHQDNKSKKHNKQKGKQKEKQISSNNGKDKSKPSTPQNVSTSKQQPVATKQQKPQREKQITNTTSPSSDQSDQSQTASQENKPKKAAWKRASDLDPMERLEKKIKGILNKITVDKFEGLSEQFCDFCVEHVKNTEELRKVVSLIFDKAVDEPEFVKMYADLCVNVNDRAPNFEDSRPSTFLRSLISQCQTRFQENVSYSAIRKDPGMTDEDFEYLIIKVKKHTIGNVNFIGELFNVGLLKEPVMQTCIRHLIGGGNPASEDCERLCTLLTTIGKGLDQTTNEHYKQAVEDTFTLLKRLAFKRGQDPRVKFMLLDVIDLRANNWVPRKEKLQPKKIEEIHREAKEAELMQDYLTGGSSRKPPSHENQVNKYGITNDGTQSMSRRELATTIADAIGGGAFSHDASSNPVSSIKRTHVRYEKRARLQKQSDKTENSDAFQTPQTPEASSDSERFTSFGLLPSRKTKVPRKPVPDSTQDDNIPSQNTQTSENVTSATANEEPEEEQYTDDESNEMKQKLVTNFLDSQDIKKAKQEFKNLRFSKVEYVYELLRTACDRHEEEREVATKILNELLDENQITKNHITKVFDDWMGQLYDALIDAPLLLDYLSGILARLLIHGRSISMNYIAACVKKDEFFVEELYDQKLIVKILDAIKIEANLEKVKAMLEDCDTALDVMVSDDKLRNSFLEKHKLEGV